MPSARKSKTSKPAAAPAKTDARGDKGRHTAAAGPVTPPTAGIPAKPNQQVSIGKAKGRPMLSWVGKRPLRAVTAFPAQQIETFVAPGADPETVANPAAWKDWPGQFRRGGLLFHGDNKEVLAHLLVNGFRGKVQLVYIDPPFDSGADYVRKVDLRGPNGNAKLEGDVYTLGEQIQYTDIWANDNYLQFMYERLLLLRELLAEDGSIYLHCDAHKVHHLRCLLDEVFGADNFRNEICWQRFNFRADGKKFGAVHDTLLLYSKSDDFVFNKPYVSLKPSYIKTHFKPDKDGRLYRLDNLTAPSHGKVGKPMQFGDKMISPPSGTMWRHNQEGMAELWRQDLIEIPEDGMPQIRRYLDEIDGQAVHSIWTDVASINSQSGERTEYPTQKPTILLERIVHTSSKFGGLVLDAFVGSGTTAEAAQSLGRRWIGCDINKGAIQTTAKRLQAVMMDQIHAEELESAQQTLLDDNTAKATAPAQLSFSIYRVNDYDLAVQHNEAMNLACEHIGVTRTLSDAFFEGTLGSKLVKIVPFGHPLSPADLEDVKRELDARPTESRDIVVVCLGKEMGVDPWLAEWNRLRKQGDTPNKIQIIELRSDPKYGKFIAHKPAVARVDIRRVKTDDGDRLVVEVKDFVSPSIAERLSSQAGLLAPKISDWRAMVDSVMIDSAYDGSVFNIVLADVPERKSDYVQGRYELPAPSGKTTVAVKVTDMLGEEVVTVVKE